MKELNKEELLAKAIRDYPVGCKFISPHNNKVFTRYSSNFENNGIYDGSYKSILCIINNFYTGEYLYYDKKWAKIISYPKGYNVTNYYFY